MAPAHGRGRRRAGSSRTTRRVPGEVAAVVGGDQCVFAELAGDTTNVTASAARHRAYVSNALWCSPSASCARIAARSPTRSLGGCMDRPARRRIRLRSNRRGGGSTRRGRPVPHPAPVAGSNSQRGGQRFDRPRAPRICGSSRPARRVPAQLYQEFLHSSIKTGTRYDEIPDGTPQHPLLDPRNQMSPPSGNWLDIRGDWKLTPFRDASRLAPAGSRLPAGARPSVGSRTPDGPGTSPDVIGG